MGHGRALIEHAHGPGCQPHLREKGHENRAGDSGSCHRAWVCGRDGASSVGLFSHEFPYEQSLTSDW